MIVFLFLISVFQLTQRERERKPGSFHARVVWSCEPPHGGAVEPKAMLSVSFYTEHFKTQTCISSSMSLYILYLCMSDF